MQTSQVDASFSGDANVIVAKFVLVDAVLAVAAAVELELVEFAVD